MSKSENGCESGKSDWFEEAVSETDPEILRNPLSCLNFGSPDNRLRSLYGLKQAGRRWYQKLVEIMTKLGFARCEGDQAVFYRRCDKTNVLIVVLVHVDDCSIVGKTNALIARFKTKIMKFVNITDMGELHWILGIEVCRIHEEQKVLLCQKSYLDSIL